MGDDDGRKLFTGRLPNDITDDEIRYVFNTYGKVLDVRFHEKEAPSGLRSAFVYYDTRHAAEAAIKVLHDVYRFREESREPISVSYPRPRAAYGNDRARDDRGADRRGPDRGHERPPDRGPGRGPPDRGPDRGGYDRGGHDRGYDRGPERYDRGGYGGPREHERDRYDRGHDRGGYDRGPDRGPDRYDRGGHARGGGYDRGGIDRDAHDRHDRYERYDDRPRDRSRSRDRRYGDDHGKGGGKGGGKKGGGTPGNKLYVANLPGDITKDSIDYVFSNYGRVQNVHILSGRSKNGRASAFVFYVHADHARKCILAMQQGYEIRPGEGDIVVKYADDQNDNVRGGGGGSSGSGGGRPRY